MTATRSAPDLLAGLVAAARAETAVRRGERSDAAVGRRAAAAPAPLDLAGALRASGLGVIAEMKPRSPSRGPLTDDYRPAERARTYAAGGAAAISVLTHRTGFGGHLDHLAEVRAATSLPLLRKDFVVEHRELLEARAVGADAVLLIVAALTVDELTDLVGHTHDLGMQALVEVHDAEEADIAMTTGADVIGVNHRDLRTFTLDLSLTGRLRERVGPGRPFVAESGVRGPVDARTLRAAGADALLVGELLMRSPRPDQTIMELTCDHD